MNYIGNISLLDLSMHGFLCSRSARSSVILPCLDWAKERANDNVPIISTFHSEIERAVLDILIQGRCPIIFVLGRSLYKKIPEKFCPLLEANRLLVVSVCDQNRISVKSALLANQYISKQSQNLTFGFISPSSSLGILYKNRLAECLNTNVLGDNIEIF